MLRGKEKKNPSSTTTTLFGYFKELIWGLVVNYSTWGGEKIPHQELPGDFPSGEQSSQRDEPPQSLRPSSGLCLYSKRDSCMAYPRLSLSAACFGLQKTPSPALCHLSLSDPVTHWRAPSLDLGGN